MRAQPSLVRTPAKLGRYQLLVALGQGGMGTIHLAVDGGLADFHKLLVVKELRQDLTRSPRFVEMFLDEARLAARLNHRNVVHTIEAGQEGERYYLSMEFLDGQPFSSILSRPTRSLPPAAQQRTDAPVSLAIRLRILSEALAGLHYAHTLTDYDDSRLCVVHRDVSPQNIFVTYDGQVKVVDFGIAKAAASDTTTAPGVFKGKFGYAAPEQVAGHAVDARTDVFAVGVILWEALTMRRFADVPVTRASVAARLEGAEPRLAALMPRLDPRLVAICDRALEVDPDDRFPSADAFRTAIEGYLAACGQRVSETAIAQVMGAKFANERKAIHRLIDAHCKNEPVPGPNTLETMLGSEVGNDNPTTVSDLSHYVDDSEQTVVRDIEPSLVDASSRPEPLRSEVRPSARPPSAPPLTVPPPAAFVRTPPMPSLPLAADALRVAPPPRERGWLIAGAGLVALGLAFGYSRLASGTESLTATTLPTSGASTAVVVAPPSAPALARPPETLQLLAAPSQPEAIVTAEPAERAPAPDATKPAALAKPRRAGLRASARTRPEAPAASQPTAAEPLAAPPPPASAASQPEIGADLKQHAPRRTRTIDTEF